MRRSQLLTLAAAGVLGLIAVMLVFLVTRRPSAPAPTVATTIPTVVAATAISFGDKLSADKFRLAGFPPDAVPAGAFHQIPAVTGDGSHIALRPIAANEIIVPAAISGKGNRLSTMDMIGPNMRAVSVSVTEPTGVGGLVAPGDRVDVYVTRTPPDHAARVDVSYARDQLDGIAGAITGPAPAQGPPPASHRAPVDTPSGSSFGVTPSPPSAARSRTTLRASRAEATKPQPITDLLVQGVRVLAVGQNFNAGTEKPEIVKTATLEVTPEQVAKLTLGQNVGTLTLALRPLADEARTQVASLRVEDLHDGIARPAAIGVRHVTRREIRRVAAPSVEIVRGTAKGVTTDRYPVSGL